jgi:hypothetical protein
MARGARLLRHGTLTRRLRVSATRRSTRSRSQGLRAGLQSGVHYIRWMQEIRRFKPSTVSRRFPVAARIYRTCVLDGVLQYSPAEHARRPVVPPESPILGFTHLQFEALLTAARESANPYDFALVAMPGLLGLRIFEATSADIAAYMTSGT